MKGGWRGGWTISQPSMEPQCPPSLRPMRTAKQRQQELIDGWGWPSERPNIKITPLYACRWNLLQLSPSFQFFPSILLPFTSVGKRKSFFWYKGKKNQQCPDQEKPLKSRAQKAQTAFCSFEWGRRRSKVWKKERGISIYIHKAKEQLLSNDPSCHQPGRWQREGSKQGTIYQFSSSRGTIFLSAMHYSAIRTPVGLVILKEIWGLNVLVTWKWEQHPSHV